MKYSIISLLTLALSFLFTSCKNDLEVLAPGKETVSVYGVLNPNQSTQNIRINKVYLTEGDAVAAGQDASQINYGAGELKVTLQRFMSGTTPTLTTVGNATKKEIVLTETVITTAGGAFNTNQRVWQTSDKLYNTGSYKLTITNNSTGDVFTSQTVMVDSVRPHGSKPFIYHPTLYPMHGQYIITGGNPTPQSAYIDYSVLSVTQRIKFRSIPNAKLYNVVMRFHYIDTLVPGGVRNDYVDFNFPTQKSSTLAGNEELEVSFLANDFYATVGGELAKRSSANVKNRRSFYLEYIVTAGAEDLNTFLQVNQPSSGIVQDKPNFSNINGGIGIFSSSSRSIITHDLWNDFIDKIACHPSTYPYRFCRVSGVPSAVPCN